ncbi:hypothetical protein [Photobacterium damselae]|uniref:hypothetical protein n=1 Tax=Photobacterium damselae TaxID=38293 RepID=UPI001F35BD76|nr:hypothetical protein [Photobacterium damselae]UKA12893.1 hypothetical protein IHC91_21105 [Photobacterium damselae subsp. damselae]
MIVIPDFPLPSDISQKISFRVANVRDCMKISELDPERDEVATTFFLNNQQDTEKQNGVVHDSLLWTGEDRRTALWWIYISTHPEDTTLPYQFGENVVDIDLLDLSSTTTTLSINKEVPISFLAKGEETKATVSPLNGRALEEIEQTVIQRNQFEEGSAPYRTLSNKIAMQELVYSLKIEGEPEDQSEAEEYRYELLMTMPLEEEFRSLIAIVVEAKERLRHGLLTTYMDGVYWLTHSIKSKEGKDSNPVLFPFQGRNFLPTL